MELVKQVCTLQQAKILKEFGINQNAIIHYEFHGVDDKGPQYTPIYTGSQPYDEQEKYIAAFTVAELGVMFGVGTRVTDWLVNVKIDTSTKTLMWRPEFLADCLIEALENNLTTAAEVNARLTA